MKAFGFLGRAALFIAGSVIGGLALAFVIVFIHPQLLLQPAGVGPAAASAAAGTTLAQSSAVPTVRDVREAGAPDQSAGGGIGGTPARQADAAAMPDNTGSYAAAVRRAAPAVVNISTRRLITEQIQPSLPDQLFGDLQPFYRQRMLSALGSGVIVDSAGHVVTNNHVIDNADTIMVYLDDGRVSSATVVGRDPETDLALLQIKLKNLPVMPFGRSDMLQVGDPVLAIGDPLGLGQTVTHGIVSATGRKSLGVPTFENFIQTDAAINAGNSGGALIDVRGELIGINTAMLKNVGNMNVEGIGFAIPVNLVRGVVQAILEHGRVIRGWVGILPEEFDDEQARQLGLARGGVVIEDMYRGSPAVQAGLHIGDIIVAIDGKPIQHWQQAVSEVASRPPGSSIKLQLIRGRSQMEATVRVAERPSEAPSH